MYKDSDPDPEFLAMVANWSSLRTLATETQKKNLSLEKMSWDELKHCEGSWDT